jgi:hypothetical protein
VRFAYGDIDAGTYLEKFYHLRILFPAGRPDRPVIKTYLCHLGCNREATTIIDHFAFVQRFSLRTLERIVAYHKIVEASAKVIIEPLVSILCIFRVVQPQLYEAARSGDLSFMAIDNTLSLNAITVSPDRTARVPLNREVAKWWLFALGELTDEHEKTELERIVDHYNISPSRLIPYYCEQIDNFTFPNG